MLVVPTTTLTVFTNATTTNEFDDVVLANKILTKNLKAYISSGSNKSFRAKNFQEFDASDDRIGTTRYVRVYTPSKPVLALGYVLLDNKTQRRYRVVHQYEHPNFVVTFDQVVKAESLFEPTFPADPDSTEFLGASEPQP